MTIPDLIASVLSSIRQSFYADKTDRLYYRDEKAVMRDILNVAGRLSDAEGGIRKSAD